MLFIFVPIIAALLAQFCLFFDGRDYRAGFGQVFRNHAITTVFVALAWVAPVVHMKVLGLDIVAATGGGSLGQRDGLAVVCLVVAVAAFVGLVLRLRTCNRHAASGVFSVKATYFACALGFLAFFANALLGLYSL